jgi:thiosulfate reductase cytochrome b subunit
MKRNPFSILCIVSMALLAAVSGVSAASPSGENVMHPVFKPLDASGKPVSISGNPVNADKTCGACHDAAYITAHDVHRDKKVKATCIDCHFTDGRMVLDAGALDGAGNLRPTRILIHEPTAANCGRCHGIVGAASGPVSIPDGFEAPPPADRPGSDFGFTQFGGAIFSPQKISESYLNVEAKERLDHPWDAHAGKVLSCTACHFAPNNPVRGAAKNDAPKYLINDPRRLSLSEYLRAPDHRLSASECRSCHDPLQVHAFLPYKERHLQELQCMSCHAPSLFGPVVQVIDRTVVRADGGPRYEYRNLERVEGEPLSAAYLKGYAPALFPVTDSKSGRASVAPRNLVTTWRWVAGADRAPVPAKNIRAAFLAGNAYRPDVLKTFDADGDGRLSDRELRLDTAVKVDIIRAHLSSLGASRPAIDGIVEPRPISHGVVAARFLSRECSTCHGRDSRMDMPVILASFSPEGVVPHIATTPSGSAAVPGIIVPRQGGGLALVRAEGPKHLYILGFTNAAGVTWAGRSIFFLTLLSVGIHGGLRIRAARNRIAAHALLRKVYMYPVYERLWHWFMVFGVLVLLITGFEVHGDFSLLGMPNAIAVHNVFAVLLAVNAFLSLFYHLASAAIHQFLPPTRDLRNSVLNQIAFYLGGIFEGEPHPSEKTPERKLNPLQQITYLLLLNVLFPLQIATGVLIWGVPRWPALADAIGGLTIISPLHLLLSWLFLTFLVVHLYLTTTGHTVFSNIKAMIDGYDLTEDPDSSRKEEPHAK